MYVDQHTKRQVYMKMRKLTMFITAVCVLFLMKKKKKTSPGNIHGSVVKLHRWQTSHFVLKFGIFE